MTDCLKIVDEWISATHDKTKIKNLFMLQDFIRDDLEYIRRADYILKVLEFLDSLEQTKEVIIVRKYVNL